MKNNPQIYFDNHATTPVDPRVLRAMLSCFRENFGNAASGTHGFGIKARRAADKARGEVARLLGAEPREIVFTSGATESNNLALKGAAQAYREKGDHIITVVTEHKSVLDPCRRLEQSGFRVTYLPVKRDGLIDLGLLKKAVTDKTILISVMLANNETGVIQPLAGACALAREKGILFHCDAAQAAGKIPVDVKKLGVDLMSFTAHKIYGPKGAGALYVRKSGAQVRLIPLLDGGGHEVGLRSGTLNVPGIVGFGEACRICRIGLKAESKRVGKLRDRLLDRILSEVPDAAVNGSMESRLPNNLNINFPGISAHELMRLLKTVALSSGSACLSTSPEPSYVLTALGLSRELAGSSVRFGLGRFNTRAEVDFVAVKLVSVVKRLRQSIR